MWEVSRVAVRTILGVADAIGSSSVRMIQGSLVERAGKGQLKTC